MILLSGIKGLGFGVLESDVVVVSEGGCWCSRGDSGSVNSGLTSEYEVKEMCAQGSYDCVWVDSAFGTDTHVAADSYSTYSYHSFLMHHYLLPYIHQLCLFPVRYTRACNYLEGRSSLNLLK